MNTPRPALVPEQPAKPALTSGPAALAGELAAHSLGELIARQPFFAGLDARHLQLLTGAALEMHFAAGESLFAEGSSANRFYLILEGRVVLETELEERGDFPIQTLGPGDDLGWSWLFPPYLLQHGARALEPTKTIFFYGTRLREQCEQDHEFGYQLMQRVAVVVIQSLQATQQRLMECLIKSKYSNPITS
jgi:CRP/FNR family cyclic AMP-dependent transcriptional regulator